MNRFPDAVRRAETGMDKTKDRGRTMSASSAREVEIQAHEAEGSWLDGWPAMLLSVVIIAAALYSFSPRPLPDFAATAVYPDRLLIVDVARRGQRLVGVGEQGKILYADQAQGPWELAEVKPDRGATFTEVQFLDDQTVLAVGHDSWIVRSSDGGQSWTEVRFDAEKAEPLLGLAGPYDGRLFAYGAFGQLLISDDSGQSWRRQELVKEEVAADADKDAAADPFADPFGGGAGDDYDPFAAFGSGGGWDDFGTRHLNAMTRASDGALWLAGERGLIARSVNGGDSWVQFDTGYNGSFYGVLETRSGGMLAHGMRGNIYSTRDLGESFQLSQSNTEESLYGGVVADNGDILLVGSSNIIIRSSDNGRTFSRAVDKQRDALTDILVLGDGLWLTAGEGGIRLQGPKAPAASKKGGSQ